MPSTKNSEKSGTRLYEAMASKRLNQADLGSAIGVTQTQVSRWISGKNALPRPSAMAIAIVLGVRWQWLLNIDDQKTLDDMGVLSAEEVRLLTLYRQCDMTARQEIIDQAEYQVGKSERRADKGA